MDLSFGAADLPPGPVHEISAPSTGWSTVNVSEALPGVVTPLTWTFWHPAMERAARRAYRAVGILPRALTAVPDDPNERMMAIFFGRVALNVDTNRLIADLTPGTSGGEVEFQIFGQVRDEVGGHSTSRRLPFVVVQRPFNTVTIRRKSHLFLADQRRWWREATQYDDLESAT